MPQPHIFVINLDRDVERLARMCARLHALGLTFERVAAVVGADVPQARLEACRPDPRYWLGRRPFTMGEVGCALSHWKVMDRIVTRNLPYAAVFEDDVEIDDDFAAVANALPDLTPRFDLVKLEGTPWDGRYYQRKIGELNGRNLYLPRYPAVGSAGYFVTQYAARKLRQALLPLAEPIDHTLVDYSLHGYRFAEIFPHPVCQEDLPTPLAAERARIAAQVKKPTFSYKMRKRTHKFMRRWRQRIYEVRHLGVWTLWTPPEITTRGRDIANAHMAGATQRP